MRYSYHNCHEQDKSTEQRLENLEKKFNFLLSIIKEIVKTHNFCPMCGFKLKNQEHAKFCSIRELEKNGEI
jgi:recombinational DNA repair protein RecR